VLEQYDREELYRKVWEQPLLKVAKEYGVSAVALGKTCRKLSVPVPGRGHWAKLAHGHARVDKPPLAKLEKVPVIYRSPVMKEKPITPQQNHSDYAAITQLLASGAFDPQPLDASARPHLLIRNSGSLLRSHTRKDENGLLLPREPGGLDVKVSEGMLERALQVMTQVLTILERLGYSVQISEQRQTTVLIDGQRVSFGLEEPIRRVVTQKPRVPNPTDRWDYNRIVTNEPSGKLALVIHSSTWGQHEHRQRWSDAKVQRIEALLPDFVAGLMRTAVALRRQEEERKKREMDEQRRFQELAQLRKDVEEEEKKVNQLNDWVKDWEEAERLRRFIRVYSANSQSWPAEKQPKHKAWIEWANQQADRLDPFVSERPPSVLDRKRELNRW